MWNNALWHDVFECYYFVIHGCQNMSLGGALIFFIGHRSDDMATVIISLVGHQNMSVGVCRLMSFGRYQAL